MGSNPGQSPKVNVLETPRKPVLPVAPSPAPADPFSSLQSPPLEKGSGPALTLPGPLAPAVPSAAPPSSELIPPVSNPQLPLSNKPDALPSLTLPPEVPVAPNSRLESISRSSPLTGATKSALQMNVFPVVTADKAMGFYRNVSFFNHTNRAIELTIEGRSVTLPAKNYLEAKLAPSFTWGHDNGATARQNVPDGAAGLDIVFRE
jgi:hypothetical protein